MVYLFIGSSMHRLVEFKVIIAFWAQMLGNAEVGLLHIGIGAGRAFGSIQSGDTVMAHKFLCNLNTLT